jgi:tetraacyldisaccharide 4'-kinase
MIKTPEFWARRGLLACALAPMTLLWTAASWMHRRLTVAHDAELPVICIGNLTVGGTGKTPVSAFIYDRLAALGHRPAILTRGYGGTARQPVWVDHSLDQADLCGDEAVMLAENRDVLVARDRIAGAAVIAATGSYDVILMDDGLQNPHIAKDVKIAVFDGGFGVGNAMLLPAGPMRVPLAAGLQDMDAVIINGADTTGLTAKLPASLPRFSGRLRPDQTVIDAYAGAPLLAFAGIGRPQRFFTTLVETGANLVHQLAFADHHPYSEADLVRLQEDASRHGAQLITTQKDWVRLPAEWRTRVGFLPVSLDLDNADTLIDKIRHAITGHGKKA